MPLALGLMSGTSCDGVSAALVDVTEGSLRLRAARTFPYPAPVARLLQRSRELTVPQASSLNILLGELFASAARRLLRGAGVPARRVQVIGSHGHTVYHGPGDPIPSTLQLGEPAVIAQRLGIPVAADFRPRDLAAGGQGAPLVPFFDAYVFGGGPARALQNIGGIANVTLVGRGLRPLAFDTGPGNGLMDAAMRRISRGRLAYDRGGRLAARGRIDHCAVSRLMRAPYFAQPPPKSTGPELFNERWLAQRLGSGWGRRPADRLATLTYLTALSIVDSYARFLPAQLREVIVSGGGALNPTLMRHLCALLAPIPVRSSAEYGIPVHAKEPMAFALLGWRTLQGRVNHLPSATGARQACVLGALVPAGGRRGRP